MACRAVGTPLIPAGGRAATFHASTLLTLANHIRIVRLLLGAGQSRALLVERQF